MEKKYRTEWDSMGAVQVPDNKMWGAQTQRSLKMFSIGDEKIPDEIIQALVLIKQAAAQANMESGRLSEKQAEAIQAACGEVLAGKWSEEFPLHVWQTGSGTQTNMNVNEVLAHIANRYLGEEAVHPNDHVNMGQSTNDVFSSAIHVAATYSIVKKLQPELKLLSEEFMKLSDQYGQVYKVGRTHLQDATPITFGQEISGWQAMLEEAYDYIGKSLTALRRLALGGTAVGTGLNTLGNFGSRCAELLAEYTGIPFKVDPNRFHALSAKDAVVWSHGALKALAVNLMKIANDVRWLASGPRCGIHEITIPENEPGSSIMPGKVNPTQCEAVTMVAVQVMGNDQALGVAASQGNFQLNVYMPLIAYDYMQSVKLLTDVMQSFRMHCVTGIRPNEDVMKRNLERSLMLVTALNPYIGYAKSAEIAHKAFEENRTLKEAAELLGYVSPEDFERWVDPKKMTGNLQNIKKKEEE